MLKLIKLAWLIVCKMDLVIREFYLRKMLFKKLFLIYFGLSVCNMLYMFSLDDFGLSMFILNFVCALFFIRYGWLDW